MIYNKLLFVFLLILVIFSNDNALKLEELIGGDPASQLDFKYQAAIVGKYNFSQIAYLLCSAGIITDYLLLSAARCFVHLHRQLKKHVFFAVVGTDILKSKHIRPKEIEKIYTRPYMSYTIKNDISIIKLKESLNFRINGNLAPLVIPDVAELFHGRTGVVAGFGVYTLQNKKKRDKRQRVRISKIGLRLKYAYVRIINDGGFSRLYNANNTNVICDEINSTFTEICGMMLPDDNHAQRGICMGDNGAPLVIGNKVVGIVSRHGRDCNDIEHGTVYTKVSKFKNFIDAIKQDRFLDDTLFYINPTYKSHTIFHFGETSAN